MSRRIAPLLGTLLVSALVLVGCAAEPGSGQAKGADSPSTGTEQKATETETAAEPVTQDETCAWDDARLASGAADAPSATEGDLSTAIIGAWQHTHIDSGEGFEAVAPTTDIRYVFPSTTRLLYCQDVEGATSQAENSANMELDGTEIVLPAPATGYGVTAWSADTMVWTNNRDGSLYLLKRR